jgi:hypothetical protein
VKALAQTYASAGYAVLTLVGINDGDLAPGLTLESLYGDDGAGLPTPAALNAVLGPAVTDEIAETDGLYVDSNQPAQLTIHHTGRGESQLSLGVVESGDESPGRGRGRGNSGRHGPPQGRP